MKFPLLIAATIAVLTACATTPNGQRAERIVVQAAVLHVIERASIPSVKAQAIVGAVKLVHTLLLDDNASVSALRSALLARVAERDLPPAEKLVALEVVNALSDEVERRVGSGVLSPDAVLKVNTVLDWVLDATVLYVPHTPNT